MKAGMLVVGGAGYIGSHMAKERLDDGCGVIVLDSLTRGHRALLPGGEFMEGDLGDPELLHTIFRFTAQHRIVGCYALRRLLPGRRIGGAAPYSISGTTSRAPSNC